MLYGTKSYFDKKTIRKLKGEWRMELISRVLVGGKWPLKFTAMQAKF